MKISDSILFLAMLTTALMAGLFFAWSVAVIPGLKNAGDANYISTMQSINRAIQNPVFFCCFFGAAVLLPVSAYMAYPASRSTRFWLLAGAACLYLAGVIAVTVGCNVPLNEALDKFDLSAASAADVTNQRVRFEVSWNRWNAVRTWSCIAALVLGLLACIYKAELVRAN